VAADLLPQLLPVGTLLLGLGLNRLERRFDRRQEALDEAVVLLSELDEKSWQQQDEAMWRPMQAHLTQLLIALRRAGAPDRFVSQLRPVTEERWRAQQDSGDPEIGYYIVTDHPAHKAYNALVDALGAWLSARGLLRPWRRRLALRIAMTDVAGTSR
jgi:hypothetical protein